MHWLKENWFKGGVLVIGLFIVFLYLTSSQSGGDADLYPLKADCRDRALQFAKDKTVLMNEIGKSIHWELMRSTYNQKRQSCFGEFDRVVIDELVQDGYDFSEYWIYDILTGEDIEKYVYVGSALSDEQFGEYITEAKPKYEKVSKDIFGSTYFPF